MALQPMKPHSRRIRPSLAFGKRINKVEGPDSQGLPPSLHSTSCSEIQVQAGSPGHVGCPLENGIRFLWPIPGGSELHRRGRWVENHHPNTPCRVSTSDQASIHSLWGSPDSLLPSKLSLKIEGRRPYLPMTDAIFRCF